LIGGMSFLRASAVEMRATKPQIPEHMSSRSTFVIREDTAKDVRSHRLARLFEVLHGRRDVIHFDGIPGRFLGVRPISLIIKTKDIPNQQHDREIKRM
jgi:hypothetical protein